MNKVVFNGVMPALMTPCKSDRTPDYDALVKKGHEMIEAGMSAVVYCGSMGDWPLLTDEQRMEGVERLVNAGIPVVVGTGAINTKSAVAHAAHAQKVGAAGLMVIPRVLSRGSVIEAQRNHFKAILAAAPDVPAIIYNSPVYGFATRADQFIETAKNALADTPSQIMLTDGIADAFREGQKRIAASKGVREILTNSCESRNATPYLYQTTAQEWLENKSLSEEVFGPLGVVVTATSTDEMLAIASQLEGQLTCTIHIDDKDHSLAKAFMPILSRKAGRVLANAFPTGVEVCDSMVHGGPYPASTNFGATSVGTMAIRRFLRPVCYQDIPEALLPEDLK
jgi:hypothetical protein